MLASDTGWPPPELLVRVSMARGIRSRSGDSNRARTLSRSTLPLNGCSSPGWRAASITRSRASPPFDSTLARVVSKCELLGTIIPGRTRVEKSRFSATRPWCTGTKYGKPKTSCTADSKW